MKKQTASCHNLVCVTADLHGCADKNMEQRVLRSMHCNSNLSSIVTGLNHMINSYKIAHLIPRAINSILALASDQRIIKPCIPCVPSSVTLLAWIVLIALAIFPLQTPSFVRRPCHCGIPNILSVCRLTMTVWLS